MKKVELDKAIDAVITLFQITKCAENARHDGQLSEERTKFKADPIWAQVDDASCVLDLEVLCDLLDEQVALSNFSAAVWSTVANLQYPDCAIFHASEDLTDVFASATHSENLKGVSADLLSKFWRIDSETAKITIKTTTKLNSQDVNSKLSRNFGTNDRMLQYKRIKSFLFTYTFFVTNKAKSIRGFYFMQIFVYDKGYVYVSAMKSLSKLPNTLIIFAKEVGVPKAIISNPHKCHTSKEFRQLFKRLAQHFKYWKEALNG